MENRTAGPGRQVGRYPDPIPGIIPFGTLTLFGGPSGAGKTTLLAEWCARWRDGRTICEHQTNKPTALYYLAADRHWSSYAVWFERVGFPEIAHYTIAEDRSINLELDLREWHAHAFFEQCLDKLQPLPGGHVVVDPVSPLFVAGNPNDQRNVARSMLKIARSCHDRDINITGCIHFGKQKGRPEDRYARPQDRIAGSMSFAGFSYTQMYLVPPEFDLSAYQFGWVPRHAPPQEFMFARDEGSGLFIPAQLKDLLTKTEQKVLETVPEGADGITRSELIEKTGLNSKAVDRAVKALIRQSLVQRMGLGRFRRMPLH